MGGFRRLRRDYFDSVETLSIRGPVPIIGTNEVKDVVDMGCVLQTLDYLKRKGEWKDRVQWYSMNCTPTWYNNSCELGEESSEAGAIYSANETNVYESTAITASMWLSRFMLGGKRRMVVVRRQDEALTVNQLFLFGDIAEKDWLKSNC